MDYGNNYKPTWQEVVGGIFMFLVIAGIVFGFGLGPFIYDNHWRYMVKKDFGKENHMYLGDTCHYDAVKNWKNELKSYCLFEEQELVYHTFANGSTGDINGAFVWGTGDVSGHISNTSYIQFYWKPKNSTELCFASIDRNKVVTIVDDKQKTPTIDLTFNIPMLMDHRDGLGGKVWINQIVNDKYIHIATLYVNKKDREKME